MERGRTDDGRSKGSSCSSQRTSPTNRSLGGRSVCALGECVLGPPIECNKREEEGEKRREGGGRQDGGERAAALSLA